MALDVHTSPGCATLGTSAGAHPYKACSSRETRRNAVTARSMKDRRTIGTGHSWSMALQRLLSATRALSSHRAHS